jgi:hypothetical protein
VILKRYLAAALFAVLLLPAIVAHADDAKPVMSWTAPLAVPVTKDVKAACEAKDDINQTYCYGVLLALYDSNFYVADALEAHTLCIPESTTATQMRDAFLDMTRKRSDQLLGPISIFYYMAMDAEFPCPQGVPPQPQPKQKPKK